MGQGRDVRHVRAALGVGPVSAGPPYGMDHLPKRSRWRAWDDVATHLPDHPVMARRIAADEPVVGLRAAVYDDVPYGLSNALRFADQRKRGPLNLFDLLAEMRAEVSA